MGARQQRAENPSRRQVIERRRGAVGAAGHDHRFAGGQAVQTRQRDVTR